MKITLPPRQGTEPLSLPDGTPAAAPDVLDTPARRAVIIGANGAGKTRFARHLARSLGDKAFTLSIVDALFCRDNGSDVDRIFQASALPAYDKERPQSDLERLQAMIMSDELLNLLNYKFADSKELEPTRLDRLMTLWQTVFPHNRVLVDKGCLAFSTDSAPDTFPAPRLSRGEKAVLYYGAAMLYAPPGAVIFADSPEMFLHPTTIQTLWNALEAMRPDCSILYITHDLEFAASRSGAPIIWVRACDTAASTWDYDVLPPQSGALDDRLYMAILGERRPVLFIEGNQHSIDSRLYPLIFPDRSVKPLGSCNKVIESTRTFNDLRGLHHLSAMGIVDRDRRDDGEVAYLRSKNIMVPEVAEIENMLLLEDVVRAVARAGGRDPDRVFASVKKSVLTMFRHDMRSQAMLHTRHRVKRTMEYRIDARFPNIDALEQHVVDLMREINPRKLYNDFCSRFARMAHDGDYAGVLRVYNQKSMLPGCNVAGLCGLADKDRYVSRVIALLRTPSRAADSIRSAIRNALGAPAE